MSLLPASIVWRISAWSCWMRVLAETGSTIPVQQQYLCPFAAMTASQAVTTVVIIVLVVVTDVALATVSPAPLLYPRGQVGGHPTYAVDGLNLVVESLWERKLVGGTVFVGLGFGCIGGDSLMAQIGCDGQSDFVDLRPVIADQLTGVRRRGR